MKLHSMIACLGLAGASTALAQDNLQLAEAYIPGMGEEVVVTATRSPQALKDTLASTTVITREQIEKSQARDLYQLLRSVPGVYMRRNGGRGSSTGISLRGGNSSGTLVLVDGVNIESASLGEVALEQLSVDQIERIEIIRGPKSSLYGSSAMNGVVQIFTRKGGEQPGMQLSMGAGSNNTRDGAASFSGATDTTRYNLTASHVTSDGFDVRYEDDDASGIDAYDLDDDAYRRSSLSLGVDQQLGELFSANLILNRNEGESEYDLSPGFGQSLPYGSFDSLLTATGLTFDNGTLMSKLQYSMFKDRSEQEDDVQPGIEYSLIETRRNVGQWENSLTALDWLTLNFGMDYTHEELHSTNDYTQTRRDNFGGYINSRTDVGQASWALGFRHDNNEQFGSKWTGDTALGYELADGVQASISYGTAYKAPSFNDLYWPSSPWSSGNPDLVPEETETYEVGIDAYRDWGMASFHVYKSYVENLIDWAEASQYFWTPSNVDDVKIRGAELQYGTRWMDVDWKASFTYEKVTDEALGQILDRHPRQQVALDMDKQLGAFAVGATLYAQSEQYDGLDDNGDRAVASGYGQLDLRAAYTFSEEIKLRLRVDNLLDNDNEELIGYNNEGRFVMFFVDFTPQ
jgi:vitamin B12 transporter